MRTLYLLRHAKASSAEDGRDFDRSLLTTLSEINDETDVVVLVGHNPGIENLLRFLTGEIRGMTTAGLAKILLSSKSWSDLNQGEGTLSWVS